MALAPDPVAAEELELPVLAPSGRDAEVTGEMLAGEGLVSRHCSSVDELIGTVGRQLGPMIVAREALLEAEDGEERLIEALDSQPGWSSVPVIVMGARGQPVTPLTSRPDVSLVLRPVSRETFIGLIHSAVEARRRQLQVRALLAEQRRLNRRLELRATQLQRLVAELSEAEDRERRRIAQILHDDLQQLLVGSRFLLGAVADAEEADRGTVREKLGRLDGLISQAIESSRNLSHTLSPPREGGFVLSLEWVREQMLKLHGLRVEVAAAREAEPEDEDITSFLARAVQELLFNAVKHAQAESARLRARLAGDHVEVEVRDEGKGFDPGRLEEAHGSDVGFGLFTIAERAKLLGGRLDVESEPGKGSTIRLVVPRRKGERLEPLPPRAATEDGVGAAPGEVRRAGNRVLIVDDHAIARRLVRELLASQAGIEVVGEAGDGETAVEIASRERPDVVVMDISMPGMGGLEATRRIKAAHPGARVVALTMFDEPGFSERMDAAGADAFVSKAGAGKNLIDAVAGFCEIPREERPAAGV